MDYEIVNDRLEIDGKDVPFVPANSSGSRFHPTLIVCHDTADRPAPKDTVRWFASRECKVSAHFVVERDGTITQMVPCDRKAFHAGQSSWPGMSGGCNNFAIGIEIDNPGKIDKTGRAWFHYDKLGRPIAPGFPMSDLAKMATKEHGNHWWLPYTPEQIETVTELCAALVAAYPTIKDIGTHWLISPGRKIDTNPLFPLEELRAAVLKKKAAPGRPAAYPRLQLGDQGDKVKDAQGKLKALGYPVGEVDGAFGPQMRVAVLAFEAENALVYDGVLDTEEHKALMTDASVKAMPVGAREDITAEDLKARGSETLAWTARCRNVLNSLGIGAVVGTVDQVANDGAGAGAALQQLEATRTTATRVSELAGWILTPMGLAVAGGLLLLVGAYLVVGKIEKRRVRDAQTGANLAR